MQIGCVWMCLRSLWLTQANSFFGSCDFWSSIETTLERTLNQTNIRHSGNSNTKTTSAAFFSLVKKLKVEFQWFNRLVMKTTTTTKHREKKNAHKPMEPIKKQISIVIIFSSRFTTRDLYLMKFADYNEKIVRVFRIGDMFERTTTCIWLLLFATTETWFHSVLFLDAVDETNLYLLVHTIFTTVILVY